MPKTRRRRRRSRRRGGQWWKFWEKKTTPINMQGNAVMVEKPARPTSRFDSEAFVSNGAVADSRRFSAALKTAIKRDAKKTTMDARANNTQSGRGRFRKRRRSRRTRTRRRRKRRRKTGRRRNRRGGAPPVGKILNDKEMIQYKRLKEHNAAGGPHFFIKCNECGAPNYFSGMWKPHAAFMWRCGNCNRLDGPQHWIDPDAGGGGGGNNSWEMINTPQTGLHSPKKKERKRDKAKKALSSALGRGVAAAASAAGAVGTVLPDFKKSRKKAQQKRAQNFAIRGRHNDASLVDSFRSTASNRSASDRFIG